MNLKDKIYSFMFLFFKKLQFLCIISFLIITHSTASEIPNDFDKPMFLNVYGGGGGEKREGFWEFRYKNGNISSMGNYKNGEKVGVWKYYKKDGTLKLKRLCNGNGFCRKIKD